MVCGFCWYVVLSFSSVLIFFLISLLISLLILWLVRSMLFNFHIFVDFTVFLLLLISSFISLWTVKIIGMISVFLNLLILALCTVLWSILKNDVCTRKKMCVLLLLDGTFYTYLLASFGVIYDVNPHIIMHSVFIFFLHNLFLLKVGYWNLLLL